MYKVRLPGAAHLTSVGVLLAALITMSAPAAAAGTGPISAVTVSPAQVEVATTHDLTLQLAASPDESFNGEASTTIPRGWTPPQSDDAGAPGAVSVDRGSCRSARLHEIAGEGPWVVVVQASCPAGAAFVVRYAGATAPDPTGTVAFPSSSRHQGRTSAVSPVPTIEVVPPPLAGLRLTGAPEASTAGDAFDVTIEALDEQGGPDVRQSSTLFLSSTDGRAELPATVDLRDGLATFVVELRTAGLQMIMVRAAGEAGRPDVQASSSEIAVRAGPLAVIALDAALPTVTAGTSVAFTPRGADRFGNPVDAADAALTAAPDATCDASTCTAWSAGAMRVEAGRDGIVGSAVVEVTPEVVTIAPAALPNGMRGEPYATTLTAPGAIRGVTFSVVDGALPGGLSLSPTGALAGMPSALGRSTFTVRATDGNGVSGERTLALTVTLPILADVSVADFGSVPVGARSGAVRVTLTNHGSAAFVLGARGLSNRTDFAAPLGDDSCFTAEPLEPGRSCSALVTFSPSTTGARTATLEWAYDIGTVAVALRGEGT